MDELFDKLVIGIAEGAIYVKTQGADSRFF